MESFYPYFLLLHLICAIVFLGYIFCDVVFLSLVRKKLGDEIANKVSSVISTRSKFMPLCFLILLLSGGAMLSQYINSEIGFFNTQLQQFLVIKTALALIIAGMIVVSLTYFYELKKPSPLRKIIHPIALVLGIFITMLAKLAFY
ncbi:copper resistance protein CopD [Helicobacter sp. MIT 11-5569]|uniref:copper resistance protein CopD n=1 Tax=Helicobacter sp. MIT 11-5569 TaxID=1548151 RepID=UPI00051FBDA1|nr:copper resistance protein CopD [Helicobacter sp. MIT 11-5569]TLD82872.1 copper resistance protein CopD [Helicobacter sp. MIT 11-5569]